LKPNATVKTHVAQRFIRIGTRRTSVRLEESLWQALIAIAAAEGTTVHVLCTNLHASARPGTFTSAIRVFIVDWMRAHCLAPEGLRRSGRHGPDPARPGP
jgi:predicted DNA-binding ribbon-helix-helix protein